MNYHYQQIIYSLNLKGIRKSLEYQYQKRIIIYFVILLFNTNTKIERNIKQCSK